VVVVVGSGKSAANQAGSTRIARSTDGGYGVPQIAASAIASSTFAAAKVGAVPDAAPYADWNADHDQVPSGLGVMLQAISSRPLVWR
jgi:hypothetical protein